MDKLQFRVLYREFLFRLFDLELLSADALGGASKLLGRFAALLIFISIFLAAHVLELAGSRAPSALRLLNALRYEHFLIATTMLVVGLFAVLSWDSTFPDRRDVLILAPLPVRARTLFLAKASAIATALGMAAVLLHGAAGLVWPFVLGAPASLSFPALTGFAAVTIPASEGVWGTVRTFLAYWTAMLAAGAFVFFCLLGVQGFAAQLLPRRLFLRASSFLQLAAFCVIVGSYFVEPLVPTVPVLIAANGHGLLAWSPSYWFLGFFQQLNGSPALAPLARRAWIALAVGGGSSVMAYALCYRRTLRQIVEEPDIVSGARAFPRLPCFGGSIQTALVQFSVRTLLRSRLHRLFLAFYFGMGFALLILLLKRTLVQPAGAPAGGTWGQLNGLLLSAGAVMMAFPAIGTRAVFSLPVDLRANWIFRATAVRTVPECLAAARRSLLLLSTGPVWAVCAALSFCFSAWQAAAVQVAALTLVALAVTELCLLGFDKIPFTCSYLPGKSQLHLAVLAAGYLIWVIGFNSTYQSEVLEDAGSLAGLLLALMVLWICTRWWNATQAKAKEADVQFEEVDATAVQRLGLTGEASWPIHPPASG